MGTYKELKAAIQQVIRTNGNNEITGALLQNALLSIVNVVGANATFAGIATPNTNPGTADQNVFYLATEAGMYVNFGGIVINKGEAVILSNKTGNWVKTTSGLATQQQLTELSAVIGNAFVKQNQVFNYDSNKFSDNKNTDATDILRVGKRLKGKMFLGGKNYPIYGITFFDSDRSIISRYVGDSDNGSHGEFDIEVPENAVYFVATNYNEYRQDSYIYIDLYNYVADIELTKRIPEIEASLGDNLIGTIESTTDRGISQGIKCQSGKVKIKVSLISGTTTKKWNIYRYVNGGFDTTLLAKSLSFGDEVIVDVPNGDDGIWLYLAAENNIYTIEYNITSRIIAAVEQNDKNIQQLNNDITQLNAELNTILTQVSEIEKEVGSITGDWGTQNKKSTTKRIGIWLDNTPTNDEYQIRVLCDNPPVSSFNIFKATTNHGDLVTLINHVSLGTWVTIERDAEKPVLYIYNSNVEDDTIDERDYTIEFRLVSSLAKDVEDLKNREVSVESWKGKTIVCFGDSITEFKDLDNNKAYADYIHDLTEAEVINIGIGGAQFRQRTTPVDVPTTSTQAYAALDIVNMVNACCEKDFAKQIAATNYLTAQGLDVNDEIVARMQTIDWDNVKVVTIFGGTNDWNNGSSWWGTEESTDINETFGAINEIIKKLLTTYPHIRLYWFTPTVRWLTDDSGNRTEATWSDVFTRNNTTLKSFASTVKNLVESHHIPICDMYNTLGWNQYNFSEYFSDADGTHPRKGEGTLSIAKKIIGFINANRTF